MLFPLLLVLSSFVLNIAPVKITAAEKKAENSETNAVEETSADRFAEIKEFVGKSAEKSMDWALAKGCEMVCQLQKKVEFGANECLAQLWPKMARICAKNGGHLNEGEAQRLGDKSSLIATGQCILAQMKEEEQQIQQGQNAKGKEKLVKFDSQIKELSRSLPDEQLTKKGVANFLRNSKEQLMPSDLLKTLLENSNSSDVGGGKNGNKKSQKSQKDGGKSAKLAKGKEKSGEGFRLDDYYSYLKLIFALFLFGQLSLIGFVLLLFLLPLILRATTST